MSNKFFKGNRFLLPLHIFLRAKNPNNLTALFVDLSDGLANEGDAETERECQVTFECYSALISSLGNDLLPMF
ncbi:hypothetical protein B5V01_33910 [Mesorhizobium erdmanii]|uniref:Uncharacterized protein n=2 Tax=Mesorhizobium TaxID=68287 RepID=A0A3M9XG01_9HYPH|nr:hypothetical protein DNR46_03520 [Mesorhizobium japonicum]RXT34042.1 hypothetical protein B5V01_33910 [Mesorhizobium erdmanii]